MKELKKNVCRLTSQGKFPTLLFARESMLFKLIYMTFEENPAGVSAACVWFTLHTRICSSLLFAVRAREHDHSSISKQFFIYLFFYTVDHYHLVLI